jgi:thiol-disulfide isomerase/thioredoxin
MKKTILIIVLAVLCLNFGGKAHDKPNITALKIGDHVPDITISNIINYKSALGKAITTAKISDFKGKLLILDFWATSCGTCISKFPEEIGLQKKYWDNVQFLLVDSKATRDTKERVSRFFQVYREYKKLPCVVDDTTLFNLFPHLGVPHYVWIKNNVVLAITGSTEVNEKNINSFLERKILTVSQKEDISYDTHQPLFIDGNGGNPPKYLYRSILTPYKDGLHSAFLFVFNSNHQVIGYRFVNSTRFYLYGMAYPQYGNFDENRVIFQVAHPEDYSRDSTSQSWKNKNLFIYEASFPPTTKIEALITMRTELDRFFHLAIDSEYREVSCLIIKNEKGSKHSVVKSKPELITFKNETFIRDYPLTDLISYLNSHSKSPVIDESGFNGTIRMSSNYVNLSIEDVLGRLRNEGFTITCEKRILSFIVLSDKAPIR